MSHAPKNIASLVQDRRRMLIERPDGTPVGETVQVQKYTDVGEGNRERREWTTQYSCGAHISLDAPEPMDVGGEVVYLQAGTAEVPFDSGINGDQYRLVRESGEVLDVKGDADMKGAGIITKLRVERQSSNEEEARR